MRLRNNHTDAFKVLFVPTDVAGVVYWRMKLWAEALGRLPGVSTSLQLWDANLQECNPWQVEVLKNEAMRHMMIRQCEMADVIVFQKVHFNESLQFVRAVKNGLKKPVVMEIDDDILHLPPENIASIAYRPGSSFEQFALGQMEVSDAVVTTTPALKALYGQYNGNVFTAPNSLDFRVWDKVPAKHEGVRIGWVGGGNHYGDLELVRGAIRRVLDKYPDVKFYCLHGVPDFWKNEPGVVPIHEWATTEVYPGWIAKHGFDIGIAPLHDNFFNRGKSNLRYLEYSSMGIPTVASNVGHFKETLTHGHTGLLCDNEEDWVRNLSSLIEDAELRKRMGGASRKDCLTRFNVDKNAKAYLRQLRTLVKQGPTLEEAPPEANESLQLAAGNC